MSNFAIPTPGGQRRRVPVYETGKNAQVNFVAGMQALLAAKLHGKPATRKHGKPGKG